VVGEHHRLIAKKFLLMLLRLLNLLHSHKLDQGPAKEPEEDALAELVGHAAAHEEEADCEETQDVPEQEPTHQLSHGSFFHLRWAPALVDSVERK